LNDKRQRKIFFRSTGKKDENLYRQERILEKEIASSILASSSNQRGYAYHNGYEKLHYYLQSLSKDERIYAGVDLSKELWKQTFFGRLMKTKKKILEVGCGEGFLSIALSRMGNQVVGTDISERCVAVANSNKVKFAARDVNFVLMNALSLDFPDRAFDWVVSVDLIEHLHPQDVRIHLMEVNRLLQPQGRYLIVTPNASMGSHAGSLHLKEYNFEELEKLLYSTGFMAKTPLIHYASPINVSVDLRVKTLLQRVMLRKNLLCRLAGLDPLVVVASKP